MHTAHVRRLGLAALATAALVGGTTACAASESADATASASETASSSAEGAVTVYLTRHGETILNVLERAQGWADSPLTEEGEQLAVDLGEGLAEEGIEFEAAYSADMVRHFDTASLALEGAGQSLDPVRDERLREIAFGSFEGSENEVMWNAAAQSLGYADQAEMFGDFGAEFSFTEALDAIAAASTVEDLPAETSDEVSERAIEALIEIAEAQSEAGGGDVLVVSSGITIMVALEALEADLSEVKAGIENAAVSKLVYDDGTWTVESVNDLSYVEAGAAR